MLWTVIAIVLALWLLRFGFGFQNWIIAVSIILIWLSFLASLLTRKPPDSPTNGR